MRKYLFRGQIRRYGEKICGQTKMPSNWVYGEYDKIQELVAFGDNCFSLVDAVCKMFKYEDYNVWQSQEKYNWQVVADYVFNNKSFDTVCNEVMRS